MAASGLLHLVLGDDEVLVARGVAAVVARAPQAQVLEFAANRVTVGELLAAVSPSLFGEERTVVIRDGQDAPKDLSTAILGYIAAPEPDVLLVVSHAGGAKGKALADGLKAAGATITTAGKITRREDRLAFINDEIRQFGGKFVGKAADNLLDAIGGDLRALSAACGQLVADTGGRVDADAVARYYRGKAEASGFNVADAAMAGDLTRALAELRWALVGNDPVVIASALADGVRTMARVAGAGSGDPNRIGPTLGMPPWKVRNAQKHIRAWTPEALARAAKVIGDLDAAVKGGVDDRGYALEQSVFAIVAARSGRG